ncbi:MAG: hypothetical protein Q8J64_10220 [Thermodesulfovibrionales bacterium]|nr:hypothetical protein [Thermodesulfovibrionales bacterium]
MSLSINTADISSLRKGRSSMPKTAGAAHINMYMLEKEKERLQNEGDSLQKRAAAIQKRLDEINKELGAAGRHAAGRPMRRGMKNEKPQGKKWNKMKLCY